jgi:glycosyltransferase involved in cell wall biosynthesis
MTTKPKKSAGGARLNAPLRVAFVVPHIFVGDVLREKVIFSPGELAREFADADWAELARENGERRPVELTLFSPLPVKCRAKNVVADSSGFEAELAGRGYGYLELLKKHPSLFVAMSRQLQGEVTAMAFQRANAGEFDVVHVYTNEEDQALIFADLCSVPVVFTHHDPYNFLIKYKSVFSRYEYHNFVSMSMAQQRTAPDGTNFVANIYHGVRISGSTESASSGTRSPQPVATGEAPLVLGLPASEWSSKADSVEPYFLYVGRIIEPKGVHLAIEAAKRAGANLKIAGKRYDDDYFEREVAPHLGDACGNRGGGIEYLGFKRGEELKTLMGGAQALIMPSQFDEPFGMTAIEAMALGTPVIASRNGALPEIVEDGKSGWLADTVEEIVEKMARVGELKAEDCVKRVQERFSLTKMLSEHAKLWRDIIGK